MAEKAQSNNFNLTHLKIVSRNVCVLKSKQNCPEFILLINQYDIIGVQKSKLDDVDSIAIKNGYSIYTKNRKIVARIALIIKNELVPFIQVLKTESKLILLFSVSKSIMPNKEELLCGVLYLPLYGTKYMPRATKQT